MAVSLVEGFQTIVQMICAHNILLLILEGLSLRLLVLVLQVHDQNVSLPDLFAQGLNHVLEGVEVGVVFILEGRLVGQSDEIVFDAVPSDRPAEERLMRCSLHIYYKHGHLRLIIIWFGRIMSSDKRRRATAKRHQADFSVATDVRV